MFCNEFDFIGLTIICLSIMVQVHCKIRDNYKIIIKEINESYKKTDIERKESKTCSLSRDGVNYFKEILIK